MTPGVTQETVDGMSLGKIRRIIDAMRHERYRFKPVRRTYIPKKNGKMRPLGMPSWSDKLVGEVVRPESVKIFWTPSCQLFCSWVGSLGGLIQAAVGSLGGSGCRVNRSGLRA